jgi:hypothetical protein
MIGKSMIELYNSDMTGFAEHGVVWAGQVDHKLLTPAANLVGTYFEGTITVGQLQSAGTGLNAAMTVSELISIASYATTMRPDFTLKGAVVNNNIVYDQNENEVTSDKYGDLSLELINYVVLQRPAVNITTGAKAEFGILKSIHGNMAFWPNPRDAFANNLFRRGDSTPHGPGMLKDVGFNPLVKMGKDIINSKSTWDTAKTLLKRYAPKIEKFAIKHLPQISSAAMRALPFLLAPEPHQELTPEIEVKYRLTLIIGQLERLQVPELTAPIEEIMTYFTEHFRPGPQPPSTIREVHSDDSEEEVVPKKKKLAIK